MKKSTPAYKRAAVLLFIIFALLNAFSVVVRFFAAPDFKNNHLTLIILVQAAIIFFPAFLYRRIFRVSTKIAHTTGYRRKGKLAFAFWASVFIAAATYAVNELPVYLLPLIGVPPAQAPQANLLTPAAYVILSILPIFFEEYLFRGTLLFDLSSVLSPGKAVLVAAFYFALLHGSSANLLAPFVAGVLLGVLVLILGSVKCAIAAHFAANLLPTLLSYVENDSNRGFLLFVVLAAALVALYFAASSSEGLIKFDIFKENVDYFKKRLAAPVPLLTATVKQPAFLLFVALFVIRVITGI